MWKSLYKRIFQTNFTNLILRNSCKVVSGEWHRIPLMKIQFWFRKWLGAITWDNVDRDICHHLISLGQIALKRCNLVSLLLTWLNLIPAWISNHISSKVWEEIIYPFPNFKGATVEVGEWISNFIPHFTMDVITYPCWDIGVDTNIEVIVVSLTTWEAHHSPRAKPEALELWWASQVINETTVTETEVSISILSW